MSCGLLQPIILGVNAGGSTESRLLVAVHEPLSTCQGVTYFEQLDFSGALSMQSATRSSNKPLGGSSGDWRHRFLRFHMPLALVSAGVLLLFMTLPLFDVGGVGVHVDLTSGAFPQQRSGSETGSM